ncbi:MAG: FkbM family methyltransferase [Nitrosopumilaceae archaeon]
MIPRILKSAFRRRVPKATPKESALVLYNQFVSSQDVVVEVGTLFGGGTCVLAKLAKQVYSFEPVRYNYWATVQNTKNFDNVKVYNLALGSRSESSKINIYSREGRIAYGGSSFTNFQRLSIRKKENVKIVALDSLVLELKPSVLVSDCEGSEREVLEGSRNSIPNLRCILIEEHKTLDRLQEFFQSCESEFVTSYGDRYKKWLIAEKRKDI